MVWLAADIKGTPTIYRGSLCCDTPGQRPEGEHIECERVGSWLPFGLPEEGAK